MFFSVKSFLKAYRLNFKIRNTNVSRNNKYPRLGKRIGGILILAMRNREGLRQTQIENQISSRLSS